MGWEILCLGRPAAGEPFTTGECRQNFELWRDGEPLYLEHGRYNGGDPALDARDGACKANRSAPLCFARFAAGSQSNAIRAGWEELATRIDSPSTSEGERADRQSVGWRADLPLSGSIGARPGELFTLAWGLLRPAILDRPPCPSRFWNT
jgi:urease accessory protein